MRFVHISECTCVGISCGDIPERKYLIGRNSRKGNCLTYLKIFDLDLGWVCGYRDGNLVLKGEVEDVASTETVADRSESRDAAPLQVLDDLVKQWTCLLLGMASKLGFEIELHDIQALTYVFRRSHMSTHLSIEEASWNRITIEVVRDIRLNRKVSSNLQL